MSERQFSLSQIEGEGDPIENALFSIAESLEMIEQHLNAIIVSSTVEHAALKIKGTVHAYTTETPDEY
jgi:hypothetical protein